MLPCGHPCGGFKNERDCLPCLEPECVEKSHKGEGPPGVEPFLEGVNGEEFCTICWTSGLKSMPAVRLGCKHVFHLECIRSIL